ncbi:MAG: QacE family quaternary ammonium compound efflux SMR transporter, partial [Acinetobacter sp.]
AWIVFDQKLDVWGIIGIVLIMSGVLVLNLLSKTSSH